MDKMLFTKKLRFFILVVKLKNSERKGKEIVNKNKEKSIEVI
jgi:hypothetical protein